MRPKGHAVARCFKFFFLFAFLLYSWPLMRGMNDWDWHSLAPTPPLCLRLAQMTFASCGLQRLALSTTPPTGGNMLLRTFWFALGHSGTWLLQTTPRQLRRSVSSPSVPCFPHVQIVFSAFHQGFMVLAASSRHVPLECISPRFKRHQEAKRHQRTLPSRTGRMCSNRRASTRFSAVRCRVMKSAGQRSTCN